MSINLDYAERLADLHSKHTVLRNHHRQMAPGRTSEIYEDAIVRISDEIHRIERNWGGR